MKFKQLIFKRCMVNTSNFVANQEYIYLGDEDDFNGVYINNNKKVVCLNAYFRTSSALKPIRDMVCIYEGINKKLTPFNEYSIFKYVECNEDEDDMFKTRYLILDDFYKLSRYPSDYFITIEEYNKIKDLDNFNEIINEKVQRIIDKNKIEEEFPIKKKLIESIYELSECSDRLDRDFDNNKEQNKQLRRLKKDISIIIDMILICSIVMIFLPKLVSLALSFIIVILSILGYLNLSQIKVKDNTNEDVANDLRTLNSLEKVNQLPLELLGKVKLIENNILILKKLNISKDILKLIYDSVNFTTLLIQYESDKHTAKKLDEFLDKTLEYVKTLKENKVVEEEYIKRELADNINSLIDRNSTMFESMVEDNKYLIDQFK